ncbi:hypothetical protein NP493_577g00006 [Ridgeia piscesae]|uniref:GIT Spa2 homology (SHD) domain-containing protein n=1 Tax=Ridgeia piscesae TaxID=27915 RepID=A0AAD9KUW4_RIDPI|nr:hypothetical protein NP493_577g00006 [Ridgeia piscesae]
MVHQLVSHGANNIWEHSLLAPSHNKHGRRKPNPRDPLHPMKSDFIRAKYQMLAFVNRQKDSELSSAEDLSKQLHSSVRTGNLETSLRLLSLGADPNYFHPERGNCPLHIAAQAGQPSQVELLVVYGADPGAFDANGRTPAEHAMKAGHTDLADRIVQCQYELTDRLAYYLCGRKPDHRNDQHFIIPQMADSSLDLSELAKAAKKKLMALNNRLFEELAMDVYDEVDRRENETIWLSTQSNNSLVSDRQTVPFLPVNPEFSATRNQGRQKLARFNAREFATLIIDILSDAKRRQQGSPGSPPVTATRKDKGLKMEAVEGLRVKTLRTNSMLSDDEPLYDSVASDEDYASIGDSHSAKGIKVDDKPELPPDPVTHSNRSSSPSSMISFTESHGSSDLSDTPITVQEYIEVKRALAESQCQVKQLMQTNQDLKQEITLLQNMVGLVLSCLVLSCLVLSCLVLSCFLLCLVCYPCVVLY